MSEARAPDVNLGDPVDLWAGLRPRFLSDGLPWRLPPGRPVRTELPGLPSNPVEWGPPCLSLHESVADLLSHIFDYSASPMVGLDGPHSVTAGALMAGTSLAELETRLKMDLTVRPASAYLLVRLTGSRGTVYYPPEWQGLNRKARIVEWLTPEGRNAMARLRLSEMRHEGAEIHGDITARQARRFLGYFDEMGTHLVRSLSYGERLFQVFEANEERLPGLKDGFAREAGQDQLCGPLAFAMAHFTRRPWATGASPILTASECAGARRAADHEIWTGGGPDEPRSLLAPGALPAWKRTAVLDKLPARSIVGVGFASQALYLEDHRADAWTRLMRAGLSQRFPAVRLSGWRERGQFPLAGFLASAALAGEEALCKPAAPALRDLAFALDMTAPGRILDAPSDCLALFAATDPGSGRAAEFEIDGPAFDPAGLKIPFLDGAACFTDRQGERSCLVEAVWLGPTDDGRPGIRGAPAEPDAAALTRHAPRLAAYARLMGLIQGPGFPPGAGAAMRRIAAWLAEAASHQPGLVQLRWQALQVAQGADRTEPGILVLDRTLKSDLSRLLESCMDLIALPWDSSELGAAARHVDGRLRAFHTRLPGNLAAAELDRSSLAAGEALQRRFARFGSAPDLPERAVPLFAAGASLCLPPDPRRMPHGLVPGDDPYSTFWNALLGLRTRYAECRAILLDLQGRTAEAAALLELEIIGCGDGPSNPARDVLTSLDALSGALPHIEPTDRELLSTEMAELLELGRSAHLLQLARGDDAEGGSETGPQLHRLLVVLEILQLCRAAGIPLAALDSLSPSAFAARIDQALMATAEPRQSA
jgi:hypothetical protein